MATNENLIPIPGRLHSVATEGHVAGADEIYDDSLSKNQQTINAEVNAALGEGGTVDEKIAEAIDDALEDVAFIDDSESSPAVIPGFDPTTDTVHVTAQTLSESQKAQVRNNIGLNDVDAKINQAVASEASQRAAAVSGVQSSVNAESSRAQAAESALQNNIEALTQSNIVVVADHTSVSSPDPLTIYREQGTNTYSDWMYQNGSWMKMAEYDNAIDDEPTAGSDNLVKSGGVANFTNKQFFYAYVSVYENKIQFNKSNNQIVIPQYTAINYGKRTDGVFEPSEDIVVTLTQSNQGFIVLDKSNNSVRDANMSYPQLSPSEFVLFTYNKMLGLLSLDGDKYLVDGKTPSGLKEDIDYYLKGVKESFVASVKSNGYIDSTTLEQVAYATYRITNPFFVSKDEKFTVKQICGNGVSLIAESNESGSTILRSLVDGYNGGTPQDYMLIADKDMYIMLSYVYGNSNQSVEITHQEPDVYTNITAVENEIKTETEYYEGKTPELASLKTTILNGARKDDTYSPLTLMWTADTHGYLEGLRDFISIWMKYNTYIDGAIHTGDMAPSKWGDYSESEHNNIEHYSEVLKIIGNHDVYDYGNTGDLTNYAPDSAKYARYLNGISGWNVIQPTGVNDPSSPYYCACYYYKDYQQANIRLIVLDCMNWSSYQNTWLASVLSDARTSGLHVICCQHIPLGGIGGLSGFDSAWDSKAYEVYGEGSEDALFAVDNFINNGGQFVCWLYGHDHVDLCGIHTNHPNQLYIAMTTAGIPGIAWDELARPVGTRNQYVANVISVDYKSKKIRVHRIGANLTKDLRKREVLCIDYNTHRIDFEY